MSRKFQLIRIRWPLWFQLTLAMLIVFLLVNFITASLIRYVINDFEFKRAEQDNHEYFSIFAAAIIDVTISEDNLANQIVIKNILEYAGLQVDIVTNGHEAIDAVRNSLYDIVLMDISMPNMDGMTAARNIRQLPGEMGNLPIIALTAHSLPKDREHFIKAGMDDYLTKPIDRTTTLHCIARWTESRKSEGSQNNSTKNQADISSVDAIDRYIDPLVNINILKQLARDTSPDIIPKLLMLYIDDARKRIEQIKVAMTQSYFKTLEFEIHALSSSAITHGNLRLHTLAKKIEQLCQQDNYKKTLEYAIPLPTIANESFRLLENYISEIQAG